jgi:hypothetical protein
VPRRGLADGWKGKRGRSFMVRGFVAERAEGTEAMGALDRLAGDGDLCAWQPVRGVTWVQTRRPSHARRLAKRRDGRLVVRGVAGGDLKTIRVARPPAWAVRLMKRYMAAETTANAALNRAICPPAKRAPRLDRRQRTNPTRRLEVAYAS